MINENIAMGSTLIYNSVAIIYLDKNYFIC